MRALRFFATMVVLSAMSTKAVAGDFNKYILESVRNIESKYKSKGYDINSAFTHDIPYGDEGIIKSTNPQKTMCVAAITEVILEAMNLYAAENNDRSIFKRVPLSSWTRGTPLSLRANLFMFSGTGSQGTGQSLERFGLGEQVRFQDLQPGDFINLNRKGGSGHAVVFLSYIKDDLSLPTDYSPDIKGFRYFSAQGRGTPDAGFGYRYGFFEGLCPTGTPDPRDCHIIRSSNRSLLNTGRMWSPDQWDYDQAVKRLTTQAREAIEDQNPAVSRGAIDQLLSQELETELHWTPDQVDFFNAPGTD